MAWEVRGQGRYYYRKRRTGGRVVSEYVGAGPLAELLAEADALDRAERAEERKAEQRVREEIQTLDRQADEVADLVRALTHGVLLASGYHTHKRQWRKSRTRSVMDEGEAKQLESEAPEMSLETKQMVAAVKAVGGKAFMELLKSTNKERPRPEDVKALRKLLAEHPPLWRVAGDLVRQNQAALVKKLGATDLMKVSVAAGLEVVRDGLGYQDAGWLEKLLIEQVVTCRLRMNLTEQQYTNSVYADRLTHEDGYYWERRLAATQRRFLRAIETLARVRKVLLRISVLQVNIGTQRGPQPGWLGKWLNS